LRALMRARNLALIVVPAVAMGAIALFLQGRVDDRVAAGAIALAVVPAPFIAPEIVGRMRGRADLAGALVLGTVLASLLVVGSRGALAAGALFMATEAFAISAMVANGLPTVRDALLAPLRVIGVIALVVLLLATPVWSAIVDPPASLDVGLVLSSALAAFALLLAGLVATVLVARVLGRDVPAAIGGAGLRDPALAVVLAVVTAGPASAAVPLCYAVFCLVLAALSLRAR
jgi:hypothetical protein